METLRNYSNVSVHVKNCFKQCIVVILLQIHLISFICTHIFNYKPLKLKKISQQLCFKQMRKIRRWIMNKENHVDSNCFTLTIICHGNEKGHLLDKNKSLAWMTELFVADLSDVETLVGKPKIIVIQACRGCKYY